VTIVLTIRSCARERAARRDDAHTIEICNTLAITLLFLASVAAAQGNYGGSMDAKEHGYSMGIETAFVRAVQT